MPHRSPSLTLASYAKDARRLAVYYTEVLRLAWVEEGASFVLIAAAWSWRGHLHVDGWDPEGNEFPLRQVMA